MERGPRGSARARGRCSGRGRGRVPGERRGLHAASAAALAPLVADAVRPGDAVLVKGSLGSRMRLVVEALERPGEQSGGRA